MPSENGWRERHYALLSIWNLNANGCVAPSPSSSGMHPKLFTFNVQREGEKLFGKHAVACINLLKNLFLFQLSFKWKCKFLLFCNFGSIWFCMKAELSMVPHWNWPQGNNNRQLTCSRLIINSFRSNMLIVFGFTAFARFYFVALLSYQKENI